MGHAGVSIPSNPTQSISLPGGTGPQSVFSPMGSTRTRWTCGVLAVFSTRLPGRAGPAPEPVVMWAGHIVRLGKALASSFKFQDEVILVSA